jgi:hypothetical protein
MHISKKYLTIFVFSIFLPALIYSSISLAAFEDIYYIESSYGEDIVFTIDSENQTDFAIIEPFVRGEHGERLSLQQPFLLTPGNPLRLPSGVGALVQGTAQVLTENRTIPSYTLRLITTMIGEAEEAGNPMETNPHHQYSDRPSITQAITIRDNGIQRMLLSLTNCNENRELYEILLSRIKTLQSQERINLPQSHNTTPYGESIDPTIIAAAYESLASHATTPILLDAETIESLSPTYDVSPATDIIPHRIEQLWINHLSGENSYIIPVPTEQSERPSYMLARIYNASIEDPIYFHLLLLSGEILPGIFPGLRVDILPINYLRPLDASTAPRLTELNRLTEQLEQLLAPIRLLINNEEPAQRIQEMGGIVRLHGDNWRWFARILEGIRILRPDLADHVLHSLETPEPEVEIPPRRQPIVTIRLGRQPAPIAEGAPEEPALSQAEQARYDALSRLTGRLKKPLREETHPRLVTPTLSSIQRQLQEEQRHQQAIDRLTPKADSAQPTEAKDQTDLAIDRRDPRKTPSTPVILERSPLAETRLGPERSGEPQRNLTAQPTLRTSPDSSSTDHLDPDASSQPTTIAGDQSASLLSRIGRATVGLIRRTGNIAADLASTTPQRTENHTFPNGRRIALPDIRGVPVASLSEFLGETPTTGRVRRTLRQLAFGFGTSSK